MYYLRQLISTQVDAKKQAFFIRPKSKQTMEGHSMTWADTSTQYGSTKRARKAQLQKYLPTFARTVFILDLPVLFSSSCA